ncbi:MAG: DUF4845 domain-containing protein [Gammaproteobacteria bacterium]|nr:DUF4845 domain-containing protein [Gammaproteobacteria bacterium]
MRKCRKNIKIQQSGFGLFGLFSGAFLGMFFMVMAIALLPPYLENFSVRSCLSSLAEDSSLLLESTDNIKSALLKKLSVSNVNHVLADNISIERSKQAIIINVDYNVQAKFIKNVDFIVHFDEQKEVSL